jgi:hypothetical protein
MAEVKYCKIRELRLVKCAGRHDPLLGFIPKGQNQDGYGRKISTAYEVKLEGCGERWYKVYASCYPNVASFFTTQGYCYDYELEQERDAAIARARARKTTSIQEKRIKYDATSNS